MGEIKKIAQHFAPSSETFKLCPGLSVCHFVPGLYLR
jgi:hypothetical protein